MIHVTITPGEGEPIELDTNGLFLVANAGENTRTIKIKDGITFGDLAELCQAGIDLLRKEVAALAEQIGVDADEIKEEN